MVNTQVTVHVDSATVCSPAACETLAESTLADDFTNPSIATDVAIRSLTALDLPLGVLHWLRRILSHIIYLIVSL